MIGSSRRGSRPSPAWSVTVFEYRRRPVVGIVVCEAPGTAARVDEGLAELIQFVFVLVVAAAEVRATRHPAGHDDARRDCAPMNVSSLPSGSNTRTTRD